MRKTRSLAQILRALMDDPTSRHWGYELSKNAGVRSGVLYPILHRMLEDGWLTDGWEDNSQTHGRRPPRRYYQLTPAGRSAIFNLLGEMRVDARFGEVLGGMAT
jgi:PadR family transcriptional regulator PadR